MYSSGIPGWVIVVCCRQPLVSVGVEPLDSQQQLLDQSTVTYLESRMSMSEFEIADYTELDVEASGAALSSSNVTERGGSVAATNFGSAS